MKVGVQTSPKFKKLVRFLRQSGDYSMISPEVVATGLLETLWQVTAQHYKAGDIGKADNEDIAESIGWYGEADLLIENLISSGWIDRSNTYRLVIHDWHEHCPTFVKGSMAKYNKEFASYDVAKEAPKKGAKDDAKDGPQGSLLPSQAKPSQVNTKPSQENNSSSIPNGSTERKKPYPESFDLIWKDFLPFNRKGDSKAEALKRYKDAKKNGYSDEEMKVALRDLARLNKERSANGKERKGMAFWLYPANIQAALDGEGCVEQSEPRKKTLMERAEEKAEKFRHLWEDDDHDQDDILALTAGDETA